MFCFSYKARIIVRKTSALVILKVYFLKRHNFQLLFQTNIWFFIDGIFQTKAFPNLRKKLIYLIPNSCLSYQSKRKFGFRCKTIMYSCHLKTKLGFLNDKTFSFLVNFSDKKRLAVYRIDFLIMITWCFCLAIKFLHFRRKFGFPNGTRLASDSILEESMTFHWNRFSEIQVASFIELFIQKQDLNKTCLKHVASFLTKIRFFQRSKSCFSY